MGYIRKCRFAVGLVLVLSSRVLSAPADYKPVAVEQTPKRVVDGQNTDPRWWLAEAMKAAGQIDDKHFKETALAEIAVVHAEVGDIEGATGIASAIEKAGSRALTYIRIAVSQIRDGDKAGARRTSDLAIKAASEMTFEFLKERTFGEIAIVLAEAGDFEGSNSLA